MRLVWRGRLLVWLGAVAVLALAVVALREAQPVPPSRPAAPTIPPGPVTVPRYAADGVDLPEPGGRPAAPGPMAATGTGPGRLRLAWGAALPATPAPERATGYDVRWRLVDGARDGHPPPADSPAAGGSRLVAASELQLDGLRPGGRYAVEVRSIDAFGQRSGEARIEATAGTQAPAGPDLRRHTGLADAFDGPFSVDTLQVGARWHLTGYPGCTAASAHDGQLLVDLECGDDLAVLRARSPMTLAPAGSEERGRVTVITDAAGPTGRVTVDLVPAPADRVGSGDSPDDGSGRSSDGGSAGSPGLDRLPPPGQPANATAVLDEALPAGTVRTTVGDDGARVLVGPDVGFGAAAPPLTAPARGAGVLHTFEVVLSDGGLQVLQDGVVVAAAAVRPQWSQAWVLIGISGPPRRQATVRVEAAGFTGPPTPPPPSYIHPIVPSTQRVLGLDEQAPGIGISREQLATAASARLVATVSKRPNMDFGRLVLQQGSAVVPAHPVLPAIPTAAVAEVTVAADLPAELLGPGGPGAISPLVLRAPGAEIVPVPITGSYLEIVPLAGLGVPPTAGSRPPRPVVPVAPPRPDIRLMDNASGPVTTIAPGSRLLIEVTLDGFGGQLDGRELAGVAGFELWIDNRQVAGVPTALNGPAAAGSYLVAVSTRTMTRGSHFVELRLIPADPTIKRLSELATWQLR